MKGTIKSIPPDKQYGFIGTDGKVKGEYFFHKSDYEGNWLQLVSDYQEGKIVEVEFNMVESAKGPRAGDVRRISS